MEKKFENLANVFKGLGHPTRLWMVNQLIEGDKCVCDFVNALDYDFSTISKHLSLLKNLDIVESKKNGKQVVYSLKMKCIIDFFNCKLFK